MNRRWSYILAVCLPVLSGSLGVAFARSPEKQILPFSITNDVGFGNEVFVVGNHADVGGNDVTLARKLAWTSGNVWTGQVAIQCGTALQYKYVKRSGATNVYCQANNATDLSGTQSVATASQPAAPYAGKTILYLSSWTNAFMLYKSGTNFLNAPMTALGPGRTAGEFLYRVTGIGEAGEPLEFVPNNIAQYDNSPYGGYGLNDYYSDLDVIFLQDKSVYNYRPPTNVSAPRIVVTNIASTVAGIPGRNLRIYLPRGYDQNTWKHYPVLYFHDGQNVFDPGGPFGSWSADATATREMSQGRMREAILVGVDNTSNRIPEYTPPEDGGIGDSYAAFLVNNVRPFINAHYRTLTNREETLAVGSSMGGLISAWLGWNTNYTTVFGKVGVMSSAFWIAPVFSGKINTDTRRDLRIYHDWGTDEGSDAWKPNWDVYNYWVVKGYAINRDLLQVIGCGQQHNEAAWSARLPGAYHFLLNLHDEANRLALELYPPKLRVLTPDAVNRRIGLEHSTLKGAAYAFLQSSNVSPANWVVVSNSPVEPLAWSLRDWQDDVPSTAAKFWRAEQLPLP